MNTTVKEQVIRYFDDLAPTYFDQNYKNIHSGYPVLYIRHKHILNMLDEKTQGKAIDIGCGSGAMLIDLSKKGYEALGIDISSSMIRHTKALLSKSIDAIPSLGVMDVEHLPFVDESFDLVICAGVIEYLEGDEAALKEVVRILKPSGVAFITVTNITTPFWLVQTLGMMTGFWRRFRISQGFTQYPKRIRLHFPLILKTKLSMLGLAVTDQAYFHFSPLPFPLNERFREFYRSAGMKMEAFSKTGWGFLGRGYILKTIKQNDSVHTVEGESSPHT